MKQKIVVRAADHDTRFVVTAYVTTGDRFTRSEARRIREAWAESLMRSIPDLPYTVIGLHRVSVK